MFKAFAFAFTLFISFSVFAGDLNLLCFKNEDRGDYLNEPVLFMNKNTVSTTLDLPKESIVVLVSRTALFKNYVFEVIRISKANGSFKKTVTKLSEYDQWVKVAPNLTCQIAD